MSEAAMWDYPKTVETNNHELRRKVQFRRDAEVISQSAKFRRRLHEQNFIDENKEGYKAADIERDLQTVARMKEKFHEHDDDLAPEAAESIRDRRLKSNALETIIIEGGEEFAWFSQDARVIHTSEFDDIFNGVDAVLEFSVEGKTPQRIALAIDASMGFNEEVVTKKINRGVEKVYAGKMQVKYFQSQLDTYHGKLTTVIPIVLGLEGQSSEKLIHFFAELKRAGQNQFNQVEIEELRNKIINHPAQLIFLKEMLAQLKMHASLFKRKESFLKFEIEKIISIAEKLLLDKNHIDGGEFENDRAYQMICKVCQQQTLPEKK